MGKAVGAILNRTGAKPGQSMVEFALTVPLLLLLLFGIVDFGRAVFYQNEVTNGAREGARIAVLASNPCNAELGSTGNACGGQPALSGQTVCQAVSSSAQLISTWTCSDAGLIPPTGAADNGYVEVDSGADCANATNPSTPRAGGNRSVKVRVVYYFRPLTPGLSQFFPSNFNLKSSTCGRAEY
jgi:Flp pilus assembly protein TadG